MLKPAICTLCLIGLPFASHVLPRPHSAAYTVSGEELKVFDQADRALLIRSEAKWTYTQYIEEVESALEMSGLSAQEKDSLRFKVCKVFDLMDSNKDKLLTVAEISHFVTKNKADTSFMLTP